jgi:hypothetical protein
MPYTIPFAFEQFRENSVDLDSSETSRARASRDYLCDQLHELADRVSGFPTLNPGCLPYGSFRRSTKIRPLNDIDLLLPLNGRGTQEMTGHGQPYESWLYVNDANTSLDSFVGTNSFVDSNKILYKIRDSLPNVGSYYKAGIHKRGCAVTLNLLSYPWVFDIVPAVPISNSNGNTLYYLIPDGSGDWIRTDPRIDQKNITTANQEHGGNLLPTMRLLKYWNVHGSQPRLGSYYFENMVLSVFKYASSISDLPAAVEYFFRNHSTALWLDCPDPKGLGPNLDANVDGSTKLTVSKAMEAAAANANLALRAKAADRHQDAFTYWQHVFGSGFPKYG